MASTAAAVGVEDSLIQTLGRLKSSAYLLYVRVPRERLASVSNLIAYNIVTLSSHIVLCGFVVVLFCCIQMTCFALISYVL